MGEAEPMELKRLHLPLRSRPLDVIILSFLALVFFLQLIEDAELSRLENAVRVLQMEVRP
jgi:hypothetical protein